MGVTREVVRIEIVNRYISAVDRSYRAKWDEASDEVIYHLLLAQQEVFDSLTHDEICLVASTIDDYEVAAFKAATLFGGEHIFPGDVPAYNIMINKIETSLADPERVVDVERVLGDMDLVWNNTTHDKREIMSRLVPACTPRLNAYNERTPLWLSRN